MKNKKIEPLAYNVHEAAEAMGISYAKCQEMVHEQGFPMFRRGKLIIIPIEDLKKWMTKQVALEQKTETAL